MIIVTSNGVFNTYVIYPNDMVLTRREQIVPIIEYYEAKYKIDDLTLEKDIEISRAYRNKFVSPNAVIIYGRYSGALRAAIEPSVDGDYSYIYSPLDEMGCYEYFENGYADPLTEEDLSNDRSVTSFVKLLWRVRGGDYQIFSFSSGE